MQVAPTPQEPTPTPSSKLGASSSSSGTTMSAGMIVASVVGFIATFLFHYGAARLSFNTYGSYAWSFLAFIFAVVYYPYYAFFVSKPAGFFGGKRR